MTTPAGPVVGSAPSPASSAASSPARVEFRGALLPLVNCVVGSFQLGWHPLYATRTRPGHKEEREVGRECGRRTRGSGHRVDVPHGPRRAIPPALECWSWGRVQQRTENAARLYPGRVPFFRDVLADQAQAPLPAREAGCLLVGEEPCRAARPPVAWHASGGVVRAVASCQHAVRHVVLPGQDRRPSWWGGPHRRRERKPPANRTSEQVTDGVVCAEGAGAGVLDESAEGFFVAVQGAGGTVVVPAPAGQA